MLFEKELYASSTSTRPEDPFEDATGGPLPGLPELAAFMMAELPWKELTLFAELFEGSSSEDYNSFLYFFLLLGTDIVYDSFSYSL